MMLLKISGIFPAWSIIISISEYVAVNGVNSNTLPEYRLIHTYARVAFWQEIMYNIEM